MGEKDDEVRKWRGRKKKKKKRKEGKKIESARKRGGQLLFIVSVIYSKLL